MKRLSENTKAYLDGICFASNFFWTEGGMSYEVHTAPAALIANRWIVRRFTPKMRSISTMNRITSSPSLSWFLHGALGHNTDVHLSHLPITTVSDGLLSRINADIGADWFTAELEEHPFGMDIRLLFADNNDQVLCLLNLAWRID